MDVTPVLTDPLAVVIDDEDHEEVFRKYLVETYDIDPKEFPS